MVHLEKGWWRLHFWAVVEKSKSCRKITFCCLDLCGSNWLNREWRMTYQMSSLGPFMPGSMRFLWADPRKIWPETSVMESCSQKLWQLIFLSLWRFTTTPLRTMFVKRFTMKIKQYSQISFSDRTKTLDRLVCCCWYGMCTSRLEAIEAIKLLISNKNGETVRKGYKVQINRLCV